MPAQHSLSRAGMAGQAPWRGRRHKEAVHTSRTHALLAAAGKAAGGAQAGEAAAAALPSPSLTKGRHLGGVWWYENDVLVHPNCLALVLSQAGAGHQSTHVVNQVIGAAIQVHIAADAALQRVRQLESVQEWQCRWVDYGGAGIGSWQQLRVWAAQKRRQGNAAWPCQLGGLPAVSA